MSVTFKDFQRNVKNRKLAIDNSYKSEVLETDEEILPEIAGSLPDFKSLNNTLSAARSLQRIDGYHTIQNGKIKTFIKRVLRKLIRIFFGWYIFPVYEQQTSVNSLLIDSVMQLRDELKNVSVKLEETNNRIRQLNDEFKKSLSLDVPCDDDLFYHCFEERFRGTRDNITERLRSYIPVVKEYLPDFSKCRFVDIGSGRGEWLDVIRENGAVDYVGIDLNKIQNTISEEHGHKTLCTDCVRYIEELPENSIDMISGIQIIEHLRQSELMNLFKSSLKALKPGGIVLFETPNPDNITVGANTFFYDPTHKRILPPEMIKYYFDWCGYKQVRIIEANPDSCWKDLNSGTENEAYKDCEKIINNIARQLYGPMDYAIIAIKE